MPTPKNPINMQRPLALYAVTIGLLLMLALLVSNIPALSVSTYVDLPFRKYICAGLLFAGTASGAFAMLAHQARVDRPWQVHQTRVTTLYVAFVGLCSLGVLTMR